MSVRSCSSCNYTCQQGLWEDIDKSRLFQLFFSNDDTVSGEDRPGKKVNLHNTIKRATKILKGMYAESMEDAKVVEMDNFMVAYNFCAPEIYASAQYKVVAKSMDKACRPAGLLDEADVTKLKDFVTSRLKTLTAETSLTSPNYSLLRSLVVCRLAQFNGRRGEEPARMLLSEWRDARDGAWLRQHKVSNIKVKDYRSVPRQ